MITDYEATILQFCNNKTRTTTQLFKCLVKVGKTPSYNYINRTLNDLVERGFMYKRKMRDIKGRTSKLVFFTTKPQGHRAVMDHYESKDLENELSKEKREKVELMMNNRRLCNFC